MSSSSLISVLFGVIQFVVLLVGIVLTIMSRSHRGKGAVLGMVGCIVLLLGTLYSFFVSFFAPRLMSSFDMSIGGLQLFIGLGTLVHAVGLILLILGVTARSPEQQRPSDPFPQQGWPQQPQQQGWQQQPGWQPPQQPGWPQQPPQPPHAQ